MPLIQPYELFGLTSKASASEVRKAYYNMALLCHPDRGGSAEDMTIINAAYEWICRGLVGVASVPEASIEYDELLAEYKPEHMPSFIELQGENYGFPRSAFQCDDDFMYKLVLMKWQNEPDAVKDATCIVDYAAAYLCERLDPAVVAQTYPAAIPHGYSQLIAATAAGGDVASFSKTTDVVQYVEPVGRIREQTETAAVFAVPQLDDYSTETSTDYELAFSPAPALPPLPEDVPVNVEALMEQRRADDMSCTSKFISVVWHEK